MDTFSERENAEEELYPAFGQGFLLKRQPTHWLQLEVKYCELRFDVRLSFVNFVARILIWAFWLSLGGLHVNVNNINFDLTKKYSKMTYSKLKGDK